MAEGVVGVDEGTDKYLHTWQRSIAATDKEDQVVLEGESVNPTYSLITAPVATTTSASHLVFIMGDGTLYTRIRRVFIEQVVAAGSATLANIQMFRLTTAGSGGGALSARPHDSADTNPYAGTIQTLPSSKGTEGNFLWARYLWLTNSIAAQPNSIEWVARNNMKPIIIGPAATDGLAIKIATGIATSTVNIHIEFTTSTYL